MSNAKKTPGRPVRCRGGASKVREKAGGNAPDRAQRELLSRKINELSLTIQGTRLEASIIRLYQEMAKAGITFKPKTYLADEWGCPNGVPVIGIPFYLADPELSRLEGRLAGTEVEEEAEVMMYLRHEAGHAFNYAYRLHARPEWRRLFGQYSRPYKEDYKSVPFSARFVHHLPGWYAQKHPDEDFAETFAVWLPPGSGWREQYADTPALGKLLYVDRMVRRYGRKPPIVTDEKPDKPVQELSMTLDAWYETGKAAKRCRLTLHPVINADLRRLLPAKEGQPAADVLQANSKQLIRDVNHWTGMNRRVLRSLFDELTGRVRVLGLKIDPDQTTARMASVAAFFTTLAMNYQFTGQFIDA